MAARKSPLINTATTLGKVIAFFLASAVAGLLVAGTMVPLAVGATSATTMAGDTYASIEIPKTTATIAQPSRLLDRDGKELAKFFTQNRKVIKLKDISPWMTKAIISVEDERFYEHGGVDGKGIARAVVSNLTGTRQGASTITQQYVANLLVNDQQASGMDAETIARNGNKNVGDKVREIKWANQIETKMSKDEILQGYLNLVPFAGATYGVEAASQRWFSKPASKLNAQESALLAGMVQSPVRVNPANNPQNALKRRNVVLGTMLKNGALTKPQYDKAVKSKIELNESQDTSGCSAAGDSAYFCNYVFNDVGNNPAFGKTKKDRQNLLYSGGLTITSTLDSKMQKEATKQTRITVPAGDKGGAGAALLTRNNKTGEILTMAQNTNFGVGKSKKNPDKYTEVNYNTNGYQGGSTAKPWTAVAWLESGKSMGTRVNAKRQNYDGTSWKASCLDGGRVSQPKWAPKNATANMNYPMAASAGLYWSINSATVAEAYRLDLCDIASVPERLGLLEGQTTDSNGKIVPATPEAMAVSPAFILGAQNVTALAQARAFGVFANEGKRCESTPYVSVKSNRGEIKLPESDCKEVIKADVVKKLNGTLKPLAETRPTNGNGTQAGALIGGDIGGKTGTSNYATSTWFAGYTSDITTISWVGRKDGKTYDPTTNKHYGLNSGLKIRGKRTPSTADSGTFASPLWTRYMAKVADRYPMENIPSVGPFTKNYKNSGSGSAGSSGTATGQSTSNRQSTTNRQSTSTRKSAPKSTAKSSKSSKKKDKEEKKDSEAPKKSEPSKEPEKPKKPKKSDSDD